MNKSSQVPPSATLSKQSGKILLTIRRSDGHNLSSESLHGDYSTKTQGGLSRCEESVNLTFGMIPCQTRACVAQQEVILGQVNIPLSVVPSPVSHHPPPLPYPMTQLPRQLNALSSYKSFKKVREMSKNCEFLPIGTSLHTFPVTLYSFLGLIPTFKEFLEDESIWNKPLPPFKPRLKRKEREDIVQTMEVDQVTTAEPPEKPTDGASIRIETAPESSPELANPFKPCSVVLKSIGFSPKLIRLIEKRRRKEQKRKLRRVEKEQKKKHCDLSSDNKSTVDINVIVIPDDGPSDIIEIPDDDDSSQTNFPSEKKDSQLSAPRTPSVPYSKSKSDDSFTLDSDFISKSELIGCAKIVLYPSEHFKNQFHLLKGKKLVSNKRKEGTDNERSTSNQNFPKPDEQLVDKTNHSFSTNRPTNVEHPLSILRKSIAVQNPAFNEILNDPLKENNVYS